MANFNGKWKLASSENVPAFSKAIGVADDWIESRKGMDVPANDIVDELIVTSDKVELVLYAGGQEKNRQNLLIGVETDHPGLDGRPAKMKIEISGDKMTRTQSGEGYTATYERSITGSNMTLVMTSSSGVTAKRTFTKV